MSVDAISLRKYFKAFPCGFVMGCLLGHISLLEKWQALGNRSAGNLARSGGGGGGVWVGREVKANRRDPALSSREAEWASPCSSNYRPCSWLHDCLRKRWTTHGSWTVDLLSLKWGEKEPGTGPGVQTS